MATTQPTVDHFRLGLLFAVASAFAFGSAGPFAKSLMEAGWSPTAAVTARLAGGAVLMVTFATIVKPDWCHEITTQDREKYIQGRMPSVESPVSVEKDLRILRFLFNILEEWHHRPKDTNPFAGRGNATIGAKRKREKDQQPGHESPDALQ